MKKLTLAILFLMLTQSAFAKFECKMSKWSPGFLGSYFLSSIPKTIAMDETQEVGVIEGYEITTVNTSYAEVAYALNGQIECQDNNCRLTGMITEIQRGKNGNASGFSNYFSVDVGNNSEQLLPLTKDNVLKIKCN